MRIKLSIQGAGMNDTNTPESYDKHFRTEPGRWAKPRETDYLVRDIINDRFGDKHISILDMGCGQGRTIKMIKTPNRTITGIDFSEEALKLARKENPDCMFWHQNMTLPFIDFPNATYYDVILSMGSHEHVKKINFVVPYDILYNGGLFLCILPCQKVSKGWGQIGPQHEWELSREEWSRHLEGDGFKIEPEILHNWLFICHK